MVKTILAATDGSDHASKAVGLAADLAEKYGARLVLLHVLLQEPVPEEMLRWAEVEHLVEEPEPPAAGPMATGYGRFAALGRGRGVPSGRVLAAVGEAVLEHAKRLAQDKGAGRVETMMEPGDAAGTILEAARRVEADMVVVGSRGLGELKGLLMGSVSHKISHMAPCTVITVK